MPISFSLYGDDVLVKFGGKHFWHYKAMVKSFSFTKYNVKAKAWSFPVNFFQQIIPVLPTLPEAPDISEELQERLVSEKQSKARAMDLRRRLKYEFTPNGFKDAKLLGFQKIGSAFLVEAKRTILGDDVGLGKTVETIAALAHLLDDDTVTSVLIIVPGHLKRQWAGEIERFTYWEPIIVEGNRKKRAVQLAKDARIFITNYELLSRDPEYAAKKWGVLILDEAQEIKNFRTQAAKLTRQIRADYKWALTATPLENSLPELFSIVEFVSPGILGRWFDFERNHIIRDIWGQITGYRNLEILKQKIKPVLLRRRLEDCISDFPEKESRIVGLDFLPEHRMVYKDVERKVLQTMEGARAAQINSAERMVQVGYLRQACDDPQLISPEFADVPSTKVLWLKRLMKEVYDRGEKAVIFTEWKRMAKILYKQLDDASLMHGGLNFAARHKTLERWRASDGPLISTDCGNVGLNLQEANWLISYDLHWNPAVMKQRTGRVRRLTQKRKVHVRAPKIRGSVEEMVVKALAGKVDLFRTVVDGLASRAQKESRNAGRVTK